MVKDNYSSGRQATGEGGWSGNMPQDHEHLGTRPYKLHGNPDTMNMNPLLINNIKASVYFKNLKDLDTFEAVVDEIYENCTYCTPWEHGTHSSGARHGLNSAVRGVGTQGRPCSTFVLLVKVFTLQPTGPQIRALIEHKDSPYIRAVGFLLIRFCIKPDDLWKWLGKWVFDDELITLQKDDPPTTVGRFVRMLLQDSEFYGTHLPRISVKAQTEINANLAAAREQAIADGWVEEAPVGSAVDAGPAAAAAGAAAAAAPYPARRDDRCRERDDGGHRRSHDRDRRDYRDSPRDRDRERERERIRDRRGRDYDDRDRRGDRDRDRDRGRGYGGYYDRDGHYDRDRDRSRDYDRRHRYDDDERERRRREEREEEYYRERRERDKARSRSPSSSRRD